jgi:vitamin B12 transporter
MFFIICFAGTGLFLCGHAHAQKDSIQLNTLVVRGFVPEKFMSGLKIQRIDSTALSQYQFQNISTLLSAYTPIAFKNNGPGQLNTASFRGTSANHTAVLWNGLNINSPSLGQTDFSTIPVIGFDRLAVQYGSAASIVGSDAVGGSILLESAPTNDLFTLSAGIQQESFNNRQIQASARYGSPIGKNWRLSGKTVVYDGQMKNQFPYTERKQYTVLPSETFQQGLVQDIFFQSKNDQEISAHVWLTQNELTLTPDDIAGREMTRAEAYRTMVRYRIGDLTLRTSWVRDIIDYAKGDVTNPDHAVTDKFSGRIEKDFQWPLGKSKNSLQVKAGGEWTLYRARIAGYAQPLSTENRSDLFLLTRWHPTSRLLVSANLRQAFVTGYNPPFTPSAGLEYLLMRKTSHSLKVKGSYGRSYRVPTLNERFWSDLGNPDIKPETGWNKEIGLEHDYSINDRQHLNISLTAYHNRIKNWTYWNPTTNYHVENLQQVLARGLELQTSWQLTDQLWRYGINTGYALNKSSQEKAYDAYSSDVIGKQLVFVPIHSGNINAFIQYKATRLSTQVQSASKRFSTFDNSQYLEGYTLMNLLGETTFTWNNIAMRLQGQVNNVTNAFYLNVRNNAMPGRSYSVSLILNYRTRPSMRTTS